MAYVVKSTEQVRGIGADYETKAMLYLMSCRDDSHEIYSFAIDFFNDVTGLNSYADKAWDVQSKGASNVSAKSIGRYLVTLFNNYMSDLHFDYLILFLARVPDSFCIDATITTFGIDNIKPKAVRSVKAGLTDEAIKKRYVDSSKVTPENIDSFLRCVSFVIDDKSKADYIRQIININPRFIKNDDVLEGIFKSIRDKQSEMKNNCVEGVIVERLDDVFSYERTLKTKDIRLMAINRIVNGDIMGRGIPSDFIPIIRNQSRDGMRDTVEDCQLKLGTILFDKSFTEDFWCLLDIICNCIEKHPELDTKQTYDLIKSEPVVHNQRLDILTVLYLISVMKEALV